MLAGSITAVLSGTLAQQPQVWRIHEHYCIDRRRRVQTYSAPDIIHNEPLPVGKPLDAYIPAGAEFMQHGEQSPWSGRTLEIRVPDTSVPAGFKSYTYMTREPPEESVEMRVPIGPPAHYLPEFGSSFASGSQYARMEHVGDDEWVETITDTIITGEGHSSWGKFHLRGRIRHWDGMITLVKEYVRAPRLVYLPTLTLCTGRPEH
jgi:hypothetical protein